MELNASHMLEFILKKIPTKFDMFQSEAVSLR